MKHSTGEVGMPTTGTTLVRRQLGRRLRKLRDQAGKTAADVAAEQYMSTTKLWRIESGQAAVKINDARGLCHFYGADPETTETVVALARGSNSQGWWEDYADVLAGPFELMISLEAAATTISAYEAELVPGLLQTSDYARAVLRALRPKDGDDELERRVQLRLQRQQAVFTRTPPVQIHAVLNDAVLTRTIGGDACMAAQLQHLRDLDQQQHVQLSVLPAASGAHAGMDGAFTVLDFDDPDDPAVVFLVSRAGATYLEQSTQVDLYRDTWTALTAQAVPLKEHQP